MDQSEHPRSDPIRKKSFNQEKSEEASNVIFNPVFSHSDEFEQLAKQNMLTDSPLPMRKASFEAGDLSHRGSRENSPRRWHSMPQDTKKPSPVPNVAKHRLKSPALSSSQCSNSDGRYSEEGSLISSDEEVFNRRSLVDMVQQCRLQPLNYDHLIQTKALENFN